MNSIIDAMNLQEWKEIRTNLLPENYINITIM